jgi:FixJ family two-component response regulator
MNRPQPEQTVHIIDDDEAVRDSLGLFLLAAGLRVSIYPDAERFLNDYYPDMSGCLVLDVQMPSLSGLVLQEELLAIGSTLPIIFITGHADVPMAVQALKAGACEFLQKPFEKAVLLGHVRRALEEDVRNRQALGQQHQIRERLKTLTPRESEVLDYIVNGKATKVIAIELSLSQRTVEIYRANVMQKMQSRSVAQLVRMLSEFHASPGHA